MTTVTMAPGLPAPLSTRANDTLSTIPDPRSPAISPGLSRSNSSSPHHPELSNEVAALSNKLIHAINHQTDLDDILNATRHDLEASQDRVRQLEHAAQEHRSALANGILVRRSDFQQENLRLKTNLAEERKQRVLVENEKKGIEAELESLTTALFEEANQMVSAARKDARKEREPLERRNEQLQAQLNDAELLLASHQEQLAELKQAMQDMSVQRNDLEAVTSVSTAPSTPAFDTQERMSKTLEALPTSPTTPGGAEVPPAPPTSFTHLLQPVLRTDMLAFEDFKLLLEVSRNSQPSSRVNSGNYGGLAGLGLGNLTGRDSHHSARYPSNGSTSSLATSNTHPSSVSTPNLPASTNSSVSSRDAPMSLIPLKETPFYKRTLTEDIEPTLRLDLAPGLSWLARRSVISSMCDGKLIVEPTPNSARSYYPPCSLCGQQGRGQKRSRTHRFKTSESETAQRYPLCEYCLSRVRASCDFLGFLRLIKDGHWRTDGAEQELIAWEESVRLRERMFWSRIGGGVVPAFLRGRADTRRSSVEEDKATSTFAGSQTSLSSQDNRPERPSPLAQETANEKALPLPPLPKAGECITIDPSLPSEAPLPPFEPTITDLPESTVQNVKDPLEASGRHFSLNRTATRSRGQSHTEGSSGKPSVAGSVAKRAAMFERTPSSDAATAASNQLQASLQASIKGRSPSRRSPSPAIKKYDILVPPAEASGHSQPGHEKTSSIPGAFDF